MFRSKVFYFLFALGVLLLKTEPVMADSAIGAVLGDPSGLSVRFGLDSRHSIGGALAASSGYYDGTHLHVTYLTEHARSFGGRQGPVDLYYGLGVRLIDYRDKNNDNIVALGPRAPLGLIYNISNPDLEFFGEIALTLDLISKIRTDLDLGVGVRVRF
jgi:hypothetical protein